MSEKDVFTKPHSAYVSDAPGRRSSPRRVRLAGYAAGVLLAIGVAALAFWLVTASRGNPPAAVPSDASVAASSDTSAASSSYTSAASSSDTPAASGDTTAASASTDAKGPAAWQQRPLVSAEGLADRIGVRIVYVAVSGGGGLIDLRFQVVDPDKAAALHDTATPPVVIDETNGIVIHDLLMGHYHTGPLNPGQVYYLIFDNAGNLVQRGDKVSVLLGNAEVDHVTVQ